MSKFRAYYIASAIGSCTAIACAIITPTRWLHNWWFFGFNILTLTINVSAVICFEPRLRSLWRRRSANKEGK